MATPSSWNALVLSTAQQQQQANAALSFYEGELDDQGRPHGHGTVLYASDDSRGRASYTGAFLHGLRHGIGCLLRHDGGSYVGNFHEDKFSGYGVMRWNTGMTYRASDMQYVGSWQRGKRHGHGKLIYRQGASEKRLSYEGEWSEDQESGKGKLIYVNGDSYAGDWQVGLQHGRGVHVFSKRQQLFQGEWREGKMHGHGTIMDRSGEVFEGRWIRGKRHHEAKRTLPHGRIIHEYWSNGRKIHDRKRFEPQSLVVLCIEAIAQGPASSNNKRQRIESLPEELKERIYKCKLPSA